MDQPSELKIGPFTYKIIHTDSRGTSTHGETSTDCKEIVINKVGTEESVKETLLHEVLHVLLEDIVHLIREYNGKDDEAEEALIRLLSPRLFQFIQDNEEAMYYFIGTEEESEEE